MLTKKTRYALKALIALASAQGGEPVGIADLAAREAIPKKFLELILLELKNLGFLQSRKGKGGGYLLSRPPSDVTLGQVVRMLDGPLAPVPCVSQTAYRKCDECADEAACGIRMVMKDVRDAIASILDSTTLEDVLRRMSDSDEGRRHDLMYHI